MSYRGPFRTDTQLKAGMESFEELGLGPEVVEALAAEGMEIPTPLQAEAIPVVRRGGALVLGAGPGAGTMVAWGAPLLDRIPAGEGGTRVLVITPTREAADGLATSMARLAGGTGHTVAALGSPWALPEKADVLFATAADLREAVGASRVTLDAVAAVVVDGLAGVEGTGSLEFVGTLLEGVPADAQKIVVSLPLTEAGVSLVERSIRKVVHIPPRRVSTERPDEVPARGELRYRVAQDEGPQAVVATVAEILEEGEIHHVVLFCRTEDAAADLGDHLMLHGFLAGAPGDPDAPVWLAVNEMEGLGAIRSAPDPGAVTSLSADVPVGPDSLDRRHGSGATGATILRPRELPHLMDVANRTGYRLRAWPLPAGEPSRDAIAAFRNRLVTALREEDLSLYLPFLEPLFRTHDPVEVAAAAVALLRKGGGSVAEGPGGVVMAPGKPAAQAWVRIFLSVGEKDGVTPRDVVGAVTGETGIAGNQVGKVEVKDTFSRVEVDGEVAARVLKALNGISIRGRAVRADYDRGTGRTPGRDAGPKGRGGEGPSGGSRRPAGGGRPSGGGGAPRGPTGGTRRPTRKD